MEREGCDCGLMLCCLVLSDELDFDERPCAIYPVDFGVKHRVVGSSRCLNLYRDRTVVLNVTCASWEPYRIIV